MIVEEGMFKKTRKVRLGKMKHLHNVPATMIESGSDRLVPPGGGLMIAIAASFVFWAVLVLLIL